MQLINPVSFNLGPTILNLCFILLTLTTYSLNNYKLSITIRWSLLISTWLPSMQLHHMIAIRSFTPRFDSAHPYLVLSTSDLYEPESMRDSWFCSGPFLAKWHHQLNSCALRKILPDGQKWCEGLRNCLPAKAETTHYSYYKIPHQF